MGPICTTITSILSADPPTLPAGGGTTTLSAVGSVADRCVDGILQYRFWVDANQNGAFNPGAGDVLLRDWLDEPTAEIQVFSSAEFGVDVRCSAAPTCSDALTVPIAVGSTPGEAVLVAVSKVGTMYTVGYTPACGSVDHTLYWADDLADVTAGTYPGQICNIGTSGSHTFADPGPPMLYFVVVGHDAAGKEGSYGIVGGVQRAEDTNDVSCPRMQDLSNPCP